MDCELETPVAWVPDRNSILRARPVSPAVHVCYCACNRLSNLALFYSAHPSILQTLRFNRLPMENAKRSRTASELKHNGLKLHHSKALPFALECRILEFVPAFELCPLLDASHACCELVEGFLASTAKLRLDYECLEDGTDDPTEVRMLNAALKCCKRLQTLELHEEVGPCADRVLVSVWAAEIIYKNAATLKDFILIHNPEVILNLDIPHFETPYVCSQCARGSYGRAQSAWRCLRAQT